MWSLAYIIATLYNLTLAVQILRKTRPFQPGRSLAWFILWIAAWTACGVVLMLPDIVRETALFFTRACFFCATCISIIWVWFCADFPAPSRSFRWFARMVTVSGIPWLFLTWGPFLVANTTQQPWQANMQMGSAIPYFTLWALLATLGGVTHLVGKYRHARGTQQRQIRLILLGFLGMLIGGVVFNLLLPSVAHITQYEFLGPLCSLFVTTTATYAIARYRLMVFTLVLRAGLTYSVTIALLSGLFALLVPVLIRLLEEYFLFSASAISYAVAFSLTLTFFPLLKWVRRIVDRWFYKSVYDYRQTLHETGQALACERETQNLVSILQQVISSALQPIQIAIYLPDHVGILTRIDAQMSLDGLPARLPEPDIMLSLATRKDDVLLMDELLRSPALNQVGERMQRLGIAVAAPLVAGSQLCGMVFLGEKRSGDYYTVDDTAMLRILSKQAAMALDNAYHYEALRKANMQLEQRVHERTSQLAAANRQLEAANTAIEAERAYLSSAINILPIPMLFLAADGSEITRNDALISFFQTHGFDARSSVKLLDANSHMPIPIEMWPGQRALAGEVISGYEGIMVAPDGIKVPLLTHAGPIYRGGEQVAAVVAFQDISALKAADRAKDEFLAVLSHELKTPLTCVLAWTEVARYESDPAMISKSLEIIRQNAFRQRRLLDDLLDVSRIVHEKLLLHPVPTDLWRLVEQYTEDYEYLLEERDICLHLHPPEKELSVMADPERMVQVISNLLNNALKYTECGGTITIIGRLENEAAVLVFSDTGRGIPAEALPGLFAPFRQVERIEPTGGLGLGLALVKGIVELHGGAVTAYSAGIGSGSTFTLLLPLAKADLVSV